MRYAYATLLVVAFVVIASVAVGIAVVLANHLEYAVEHPEGRIDSVEAIRQISG